jgi:hypothetical protein
MTMRNQRERASTAVDRRSFLQVGAAGLFGLSLADSLRAEAGRARSTGKRVTGVILVFLKGGPSHIDMWDVKPEAPLEIRWEFRPVATSVPGVQVCEHLPKLAKVMDRVTVVRSLHHVINDHGAGPRYVLSGRLPGPANPPALGALAAALLPAKLGMPAGVTLKAWSEIETEPGRLGAAYRPLKIDLSGDPGMIAPLLPEGLSLPDALPVAELENRERLRRQLDRSFARLDRTEVPARLDRFQQQALDILRSDKVRRALDVATEPLSVRKAYGLTDFRAVGSPVLARALLAARRLIEAGARFVTVGAGGESRQAPVGWDTHEQGFAALRSALLPTLDLGLPALIADLDDRGLLAETVVYCVGEFGRTPLVNIQGGRDHWPQAMAALVAGGGFRRGYVYGATDRLGKAPAQDPCTPADVAATIFDRLGFPPAHRLDVLRDTSIFPEGRVLRELTGA